MTHKCHAVGCRRAVPPELLMCLKHWRAVPKDVQRAVWRNYRPGQCDDKDPSQAWLEAADLAIVHVAVQEGRKLSGRYAEIAASLKTPSTAPSAAAADPPAWPPLPEDLEL